MAEASKAGPRQKPQKWWVDMTFTDLVHSRQPQLYDLAGSNAALGDLHNYTGEGNPKPGGPGLQVQLLVTRVRRSTPPSSKSARLH